MSEKIQLRSLSFFREPSRIQKLNDLFEIQDTLMPHQVAVATGCSYDDAFTILLLLYHRYLAESYLLVYHNQHNNTPILALGISEGLPELPIQCDLCDVAIENEKELSYGFIFSMNSRVIFGIDDNATNEN